MGLRWAIGRAGAMAVIWVQIAKTANRAVERTEPDVHPIKQVEQVTKSAWEDTWLLFGCKNSQNILKRPGDLFAKGQSGNAAGPKRRFHEPGPWAAEPLLRQIR
jgi:hypothetical protein